MIEELDLNGRGLLVYSDPGGAKPILAFTKLCGLRNYCLLSNREYDFVSDYNLEVTNVNVEYVGEAIDEFNPDFIFTGTSYTSDLEVKFIDEGKKRGIFTGAFIDHYTRYLDRFFLDGSLCLPDLICLTDEKAYDIAISEGIHLKSKVKVTGNFHHDFLRAWRPTASKKSLLGNLIDHDRKILCFAPDPLSNVGGFDKYGFDECTIWKLLCEALEGLGFSSNDLLIIPKLHPNQSEPYIKKAFEDSPANYMVSNVNINTIDLLYHSDLIIGMYSSILVEASLLQTPVIRCIPNLQEHDALSGMNLGPVCDDVVSLRTELERYLK